MPYGSNGNLPDVKISGIYSRTEQSARALADDFDIEFVALYTGTLCVD